jgi:biotin synthase-like enzyme
MKQIDTNSFNRRAPEMVAREEILRLAKSQQANLATSFEDLLGDGGPPDETADEMIRAIREWRDLPSTRSLD